MVKGVLIPLITPFDEKQKVDEGVMRQLVDFYVKTSVQGLFVLGSSGQGPAMSLPERKRAAEVALGEARASASDRARRHRRRREYRRARAPRRGKRRVGGRGR